jgi:hypothetical protein
MLDPVILDGSITETAMLGAILAMTLLKAMFKGNAQKRMREG